MTECSAEHCPCPKKECERHGNCCECVPYHRGRGNIVFCFRAIAEAQAAAAVEAARK